jgi:hypothetical protein
MVPFSLTLFHSRLLIPFSLSPSAVAITAPAVTDTVYPEGCYGILGYGVDPAADVPANSTLLGVYLPGGLKNTEAVCGIELNRADVPGVPGGTFTMGGKDDTACVGVLLSLCLEY